MKIIINKNGIEVWDKNWIISFTVANGQFNTLKYLINNGYICNKFSVNWCASKGNMPYRNTSDEIHIKMLHYLFNLGYKGDITTCYDVAQNGYFKILQYLESIGYILDGRIIDHASAGGNLNIIKYLHKKGYRGTDIAIINAVENYDFNYLEKYYETIKYLLKHKYKFTSDVFNYAIGQQINTLLMLNKNLMI